jgi:hypothetical protein
LVEIAFDTMSEDLPRLTADLLSAGPTTTFLEVLEASAFKV